MSKDGRLFVVVQNTGYVTADFAVSKINTVYYCVSVFFFIHYFSARIMKILN